MNTSVPSSTPRRLRRVSATALSLGLCVATLAGCSGNSQPSESTTNQSTASARASDSQKLELSFEKSWVKASDTDMTGVFGTLRNTGKEPVTITGAQAPHGAKYAEFHVTETDPATGSTVMKKRTDPLVVEPGSTVELKPGGDHIMLMQLTCDLTAGSDLEITIETDRGNFKVAAPVRDYAGAKEEYAPGDHASHSPGSHESSTGTEHHTKKATPSPTSMPECNAG